MNKLGLIIALLFLSGCSGSNVASQWDCPAQKGYPCITITKADNIAKSKLEIEQKAEGNEKPKKDNFQNIIESSLEPSKTVWFAPYTDKKGNYHEASIVHFTIGVDNASN